jgi:hypothetical protein
MKLGGGFRLRSFSTKPLRRRKATADKPPRHLKLLLAGLFHLRDGDFDLPF